MTETRKAIIDLIEPYMDKTLSEGCLVFKNNWIMKIKHNELYELNNIICFKNGLLVTEIELLSNICSKILGYYDITAVLKYIMFLDTNSIKVEIFDDVIKIYNRKIIFHIPNKPLHLYTEKEDTQLLELLLKLK